MEVFVPAVQRNSVRPFVCLGNRRPAPRCRSPVGGSSLANPTRRYAQINTALALGRNLLLTPGVYHLSRERSRWTRPNTIVLGLGFATLIPLHGNVAMQKTASVPGIKLSGMIFDAGTPNSPVLLQLGSPKGHARGLCSGL